MQERIKVRNQKDRLLKALFLKDRPNYYFPTVLSILNYTSVISRLREDDFEIVPYKKDEDSNTWWYHLGGV